MKRAFFGVLALALAVTVGAVSTGGFPSFLRIQALGVNATPTAGSVTINASSGAVDTVYQDAGGNQAFTCLSATAGACDAGDAQNDFSIRTVGHAIHFTINNGTSDALKIDGSGNITTPAPGTVPWSVSPIVCTTTCSVTGIVVGQSAIVDLTSTTVTSNAVLAVNNLNFSNLPVGSYLITMSIPVLPNGGGAQVGWTSCTQISADGSGVWTVSTGGTPWGTVFCTTTGANDTNASLRAAFNFTGTYVNAVGGANTTFAWAQSSSNAGSTNFCVSDCIAILTRVK